MFLVRIKQNPFPDVWSSGLQFWRVQNHTKMLPGRQDVFCPGKYCFSRGKSESLDGYATTPRSIYGCGKCGAWLFVHEVPFTLQEHLKTTETDKTRFFFARKG